MTGNEPSIAGIYGKIPSFGDYVHRRLPSSFVEPLNAWVGTALAKSREVLGPGWMNAYLTSPPWRFLLEPGVIGAQGWLGVLVSSVDEVGRCYPIVTAVALSQQTRLGWLGEGLGSVADRLEAVALDLIDGRTTPDQATATLAELAPLAKRSAAPIALLGRNGPERLSGHAVSHLAGLALRWLVEAGPISEDHPLSIWWHGAWNSHSPAHFITPGLPPVDTFASFLDGAWSDRGWTEQMSDRELP